MLRDFSWSEPHADHMPGATHSMVTAELKGRLFEGIRHSTDVSTHLYLVRHGQTTGNVNHLLVGHMDMPMDELGIQQAREVGIRMRSIALDAIVSSPLIRARFTADQIALHQQSSPVIDHRLMEINFGHVEGLTVDEACLRFPEIERLNSEPLDDLFTWPGGDQRSDFHRRVMETVTDLAMRHQEQHLAIVCHGGVIGSIIAQLDGGSPNDYATYPIANCSVTHLEVHNGGTMVHLLNDIAHLEAVRTEPFTYTIPASEHPDASQGE
jgi:broad specificity phosphatase PhoE